MTRYKPQLMPPYPQIRHVQAAAKPNLRYRFGGRKFRAVTGKSLMPGEPRSPHYRFLVTRSRSAIASVPSAAPLDPYGPASHLTEAAYRPQPTIEMASRPKLSSVRHDTSACITIRGGIHSSKRHMSLESAEIRVPKALAFRTVLPHPIHLNCRGEITMIGSKCASP